MAKNSGRALKQTQPSVSHVDTLGYQPQGAVKPETAPSGAAGWVPRPSQK